MWRCWDLHPGLSGDWVLLMGFSAAQFTKTPRGRASESRSPPPPPPATAAPPTPARQPSSLGSSLEEKWRGEGLVRGKA